MGEEKREQLSAGRGEGSRGVCVWKGSGERGKSENGAKLKLREPSARCLQEGVKAASKSEGESGKPGEGKEVRKEEGRQEGREEEWLQFLRPAQ